MKVTIHAYHGVAAWKWDTSSDPHQLFHYSNPDHAGDDGDGDGDDDDDVCGICRLAFESCCPECKVPGDDCPLIWGECTHVFHMHCLLKWIDTESSRQQCPLDRRPWETADRRPDKLPTTVSGDPKQSVAPGPIESSVFAADTSAEQGHAAAAAAHAADSSALSGGSGMQVDDARS